MDIKFNVGDIVEYRKGQEDYRSAFAGCHAEVVLDPKNDSHYTWKSDTGDLMYRVKFLEKNMNSVWAKAKHLSPETVWYREQRLKNLLDDRDDRDEKDTL